MATDFYAAAANINDIKIFYIEQSNKVKSEIYELLWS